MAVILIIGGGIAGTAAALTLGKSPSMPRRMTRTP
jgi:2-polyprenyl-6-methoxyphenol hydroxylase-like FAD-dependent oxidoreductase